MADGSVRFLAKEIDDKTLQALFTRDGKEPFLDLSVYEVPSVSWPPQIAFVSPVRPIPAVVPGYAELSAQIRRLGAKPLAKGYRSSWSPDGKRIVYGRYGASGSGNPGEGITVLDVETGKSKDLTGLGKDPAWSGKDGRLIAYVIGCDFDEEVWLIDASGKNPRRIAEGGFPSWSADGKQLGFGGFGGEDPVPFHVLDVGSGRRMFVGPQWLTLPAWSPDGSKLSFDVRSSHGWEIWLIETKNLKLRPAPPRSAPPPRKRPAP
jgi:hypothetical protein